LCLILPSGHLSAFCTGVLSLSALRASHCPCPPRRLRSYDLQACAEGRRQGLGPNTPKIAERSHARSRAGTGGPNTALMEGNTIIKALPRQTRTSKAVTVGGLGRRQAEIHRAAHCAPACFPHRSDAQTAAFLRRAFFLENPGAFHASRPKMVRARSFLLQSAGDSGNRGGKASALDFRLQNRARGLLFAARSKNLIRALLGSNGGRPITYCCAKAVSWGVWTVLCQFWRIRWLRRGLHIGGFVR